MLKQVALIALMGMSASAMAGQWQVKVGGFCSCSNWRHKYLGGAAKVEADDEYAFPAPSVEYFFNDNISTELLLATPIRCDVLLNGDNAVKLNSYHLP